MQCVGHYPLDLAENVQAEVDVQQRHRLIKVLLILREGDFVAEFESTVIV